MLYWAKLGPTVYDRAFLAGRPFAGVDREQMQPKKTPNLGYQSIDLSPIHASRTWRFTAEAIVLQALTAPTQPVAVA